MINTLVYKLSRLNKKLKVITKILIDPTLMLLGAKKYMKQVYLDYYISCARS